MGPALAAALHLPLRRLGLRPVVSPAAGDVQWCQQPTHGPLQPCRGALGAGRTSWPLLVGWPVPTTGLPWAFPLQDTSTWAPCLRSQAGPEGLADGSLSLGVAVAGGRSRRAVP